MRSIRLAAIFSVALSVMSVVRLSATDLVQPREIYGNVSLQFDASPDGSIRGVLKNYGAQGVRDVRLLVQHSWLWNDERNPGPAQGNPGRTEYYVVSGDVLPGGELQFRYAPTPPLMGRSDGRIITRPEIVGLTEFPPD
jgi:hypothetical protein